MMEPSGNQSTTSSIPMPMPQPAGSSSPAVSLQNSIRVPKALMDQADVLAERLAHTDIARINGYMRLTNLVGAGLFFMMAIWKLFSLGSYFELLVIIYTMVLAGGLVFIENHEQFPSQAEKVKMNFGFMFTAFGKASYLMSISFLSFAFGWIGIIVGVLFMVLALFNFFLIYKHPAYRSEMTRTDNGPVTALPTVHKAQPDEDMPELRYNQAAPVIAGNALPHVSV